MSLAKSNIYTAKDYYNLPKDIRAELIEGELIYNLAAPSRIHQKLTGFFLHKIQTHIDNNKGTCEVYPAPFAVRISGDDTTVVEPDISVICDPSKLTDKGCDGAPDWIIEIVSPSSVSRDYFVKLNLYKKAGVKEYWIVDPVNGSIFVYCLEEEHFSVKSCKFIDRVKSYTFDDFYIDLNEIEI